MVEVMVAFLIIAIVAAAGTSLTVRGLRATLEAKQVSQAKNLVNEQVERMRGLPFFVAYATSPARVDVLDSFYPDMAAPTSAPSCSADATTWVSNKTAWTGYVAAGAARCAFEPTAGAFYRTVVDPAVVGSTPTAVVVSTQFLGLAPGDGSAAQADAPSDRLRLERNNGTGHPGCQSDRRIRHRGVRSRWRSRQVLDVTHGHRRPARWATTGHGRDERRCPHR